MPVQLKIAPSLGELEGHPNTVWGTEEYGNLVEPAVFMGLYSLNDFNGLRNHRGRKWVFWCGSDVRHFINGYWLDEEGKIKIDPKPLSQWINKYCESWVENRVEAEALASFGINSFVAPSFMGNIDDYEVSFTPNKQFYASVSGNDFHLYGWDKIEEMAPWYPEVDFHLYGNTQPWPTKHKNVIVHGRVPKEQMNEEIKKMHGGLRLLPFDGFSEVLAKSVLWGQWPVSAISYPHILTELDKAITKDTPNYAGRNYYRRVLNQYPWVSPKNQL